MRLERVAGAAVLLALVLLWHRWDNRPIEHPPGVLVPEAPVQSSEDKERFRQAI